ncbi:hypothetical protein, partial [Methanocella conradii]|uniref:hypothetical protein n=1 Tax=Methanocella conradii TaxID=1175444 RepID=UPI001C2D4557
TEATEVIFTTEVHRGHRGYIHHGGSQRPQRLYSPRRFTEATEVIFTTEVHRGHRGFLFPKGGLVAPLGDPLNL